jgi:hypothetical protein
MNKYTYARPHEQFVNARSKFLQIVNMNEVDVCLVHGFCGVLPKLFVRVQCQHTTSTSPEGSRRECKRPYPECKHCPLELSNQNVEEIQS